MKSFMKKHGPIFTYAITAIGAVACATGIGWVFRIAGFPETNIVIVYILFILLTARLTQGYYYGIAASVLATFTFNYFFTQPYYTLSVSDPSYLVTFVIMTLTTLITSTLTSKVKKSASTALAKEAEASALFQLTNRLTDAATIADIASITTNTISNVMRCRAACLCFDENGQPEQSFIQQQDEKNQVRRHVENPSALKHRIEGLRTPYDIGTEFYDWPIYGRNAILGILRIPAETAQPMSETQTRLLHSMIESAALAMDRFRSAEEEQKSRQETERERYRSNLLRAISHDLRTPLSGIMGTSEMLMDMTDEADERHTLAADIYSDADWLHSMMENILNLTRLQDGNLVLSKEAEAVEEVIGVAVAACAKRAPDREILVHIPDEILLVPMDARLIEQTLVNLLDNAIKHTAANQEISISVKKDTDHQVVVFTIADRGSGIREEDLPNIFQAFYTTRAKGPDTERGVGLGLAICSSVVAAHGGTILARNRTDGPGSEFVFTLPLEMKQHDERQ